MEPGTRPAFSLPSDNQIRLILVTLVGLGAAIYLGMRVGEGDIKFIMGLMVVAAVAAAMVAMGERAWLLLALGMNMDVPVPLAFGRDFSAKELVAMALILHAAIRIALRRQKVIVFRKDHLWPMLYAGWALMVFAANPIGFQSFGSEDVGARFYFQIFLGLCLFLIVANLNLKEQDIKWYFAICFVTVFVNLGYLILNYGSGVPEIGNELFKVDESFYTWHQALTGPSFFILYYIVARYPMQKILQLRSLPLWGIMVISVGVIIYSGKRAATGILLLLPIFGAILRRRYGSGFFLVLGAVAFLALAVFSHGRWVSLPLSAQRALSWLPGDWDVRVANLGIQDEFRLQMRMIAIDEIEKHPWLGPGFAMNIKDFQSDRAAFGMKITAATTGHSWHTTWLGIAADFGIPAAVIWGLLWLNFFVLGYRVFQRFPEGNWGGTLAASIFLAICTQIATSYTGGHSAQGAFHYWWVYALLIPLGRMADEAGKRGKESSTLTERGGARR